ncbi:MAG TPA: hypothetical protein VFH36_11910 [Acidimicrobiales bacterium]|nr:hypothetical protein [Acidimicrobiales bacterium]
MPSPTARIDRGLHFLQRRGVSKGVIGSSRGWFWVAVVTWTVRRVRRAIGSEYELVYRGTLKPGEVLEIGHRTETYDGRRVRARRRKVQA